MLRNTRVLLLFALLLLSLPFSKNLEYGQAQGSEWTLIEQDETHQLYRSAEGLYKWISTSAPIAEICSVTWESGGFKLSYRDKWVTLEPFIVYLGKVRTIADIRAAFPNVTVTDYITTSRSHHKFSLDFSGVPQQLLENVDYLGFRLKDSYGLSWDDVEKSGNYSIVIKNKVEISYYDLIESGYTLDLVNKTCVLIGNITAENGVISLDPTVQLTGADVLKDSWTDQENPTTNYGSDTGLDVAQGSVYATRAYVEFNTSSIPAGAIVTEATLSLYKDGYGGSGSRTFRINLINESWAEGSVTWNNAPSINSSAYVDRSITLGSGSWWNVSVTGITYRNDSMGYRIIHYSGATGVQSFRSKEYDSTDPTLTIHYSIAPTAPTLVSPANETTQKGTILFNWTFNDADPEDVQGWFSWQLAYDTGFTDLAMLPKTKEESSETDIEVTLPSTKGPYYWRVKTWDSHELEGPWSATWCLTVNWSYSYTLKGLFWENGTFFEAVNVTAFYANDTSAVFEVNGSHTEYFESEPRLFRYPLSDGLHRNVYSIDNETFYLFNPFADYASYHFTLKDYTGTMFGSDAYLESYRYVNDTLFLVERWATQDVATTLDFIMQLNETYLLVGRAGDCEYRLGWFTAGADTTQELVVHISEFSTRAKLTYRYVIAEAWRSTDNKVITVNYQDLLLNTSSVTLYIKYKNGTTAYTDSGSANIIQFQWNNANSSINYKVELAISHDQLGSLTYKQALPVVAAVSSPFDLGMLGNWPIASGQIIPIALIFIVAAVFSTLTAHVGIIVTILFAGFLRMMGWLDTPLVVLSTAGSLAIIWVVGETKRRMGE